jgi:hypothetical protein
MALSLPAVVGGESSAVAPAVVGGESSAVAPAEPPTAGKANASAGRADSADADDSEVARP